MACKAENHINERGWYVPHLSWEGWEEFNLAAYALRCILIWSKLPSRNQTVKPLFNADFTINRSELHRGMGAARLVRSFHFHIDQSRHCARPALPP
jgi:hypothetical protein